ncbi:MAG TPA: hypothetical protein VFF06_35785 [Polyangia bacterium]|nr:hypothetical protein [Polyangia bacterium]
MNIPPDDDPNAVDPNALDPSLALKKKGSKMPLLVGLVVVVGVGGFFVWKMMKKQDERKMHAAFIQSFADIEKDDVGKFWNCILGKEVDARQLGPGLGGVITGRFGVDAKNYPTKVREECTPKAIDAKHKVDALTGPPEYAESVKKYGESLKGLASAFDAWAKIAPSQVADMEIGKKVESDGNAWHMFAGGKPGNDVIQYDQFLHCAIPAVDTMKDGQAVVEYLFKECKNPAYATRINDECGKLLLNEIPGAPTKNMAATIKKLAADSRELEAFDDCMRKGRKGKRSNDFGDVAKAYNDWMDAGADVRKIGKEALKE